MLLFYIELLGDHSGMVPFDLSYLNALHEAGLKVIWVASETNVDSTPQSAQTGVEVWAPFHGMYSQRSRVQRGLRYARGLWAVLRRASAVTETHQVVIHQQFVVLPGMDFLFVLLARLAGLVCILSPHDVVPYADRSRTNWILPLLYRQYDAIVVHSKAARDEIVHMLHGTVASTQVRLIPHGHLNDQRGNQRQVDQAAARDMLHIPPSAPVALFMGQIKREKGLEILLDAMPHVLSAFPQAQLIIVGRPYHIDVAGYERQIDALGLRASVRVRWEYVTEDEMAYYFGASDVVVLPYLRAYQSGVCLTAYSYFRPVVASATGGLVDQVLDGQTGYLVPPADPRALALAIARVFNDKACACEMGRFAHDWVARAEDWGAIAAESVRLYQDALIRRGRQQA